MRPNNKLAGVLLCALIGVACSGPPKRSPAAAATPVAHPTTTGTSGLVNASLVKQGYRVVKRGDQVLYCRSQSVTGTLFLSTVCLTESQIRDQDAGLQQSKDILNQSRPARCVGNLCAGG
jgi:hypothetical protein